MARMRIVKPGFFTNEEIAELPPLTRLLFVGLWTVADRRGRLEDRPKRIKAELMPYDNHPVDTALDSLCEAGFITRYTVDQKKYIQINKFEKHQHCHVKEPESTIPAPCETGANPSLTGTGTEQEHIHEQAGKPEISNDLSLYHDPFAEFWDTYPHRDGAKVGKPEAWNEFIKLAIEEIPRFLKAVRNFRESKRVKEKIGIPDPVRFLVKGRAKEKVRPWIEWENMTPVRKGDPGLSVSGHRGDPGLSVSSNKGDPGL